MVDVIERATSILSTIVYWPNAAQVVFDMKVLDYIEELFGSLNKVVQARACWLVGNFASHESIAPAVSTTKTCVQLLSLLRVNDTEVVEQATYALSQISWWSDGAQAAIDAKVLHYIENLLSSSNQGTLRWGCSLVGNFSSYQSIAPEVFRMKTCVQLVSLLRHTDAEVIEQATYALRCISQWPNGAQAAIDAKVLDYIEEFLSSSNEKCPAPALLTMRTCVQFVLLLRHKDVEVVQRATYALGQISRWSDGAWAAFDAKVLVCIEELLGSSNQMVQRWACALVGNLASHESIAPAVLSMKPCIRLVSLLHHTDAEVIEWTTYALGQISRWPDGAQAAVDAKVLDSIEELLRSSNEGLFIWACRLVGNLASHESIAPAVLTARLCFQLVSLLRHKDAEIIHRATYALSEISQWPNGAQAAVDAKVLDYIEELFTSSNEMVQRWACTLVGDLASHVSIAPAVLTARPCIPLVSLLRQNDALAHRVAYALAKVSYWPNGAQAAIDAKVLDHVVGLLGSPHPVIRSCTSQLVRNLASHDSTAPAIAGLNFCLQLVSILNDEDEEVVKTAIYVLCRGRSLRLRPVEGNS
ncbi:armadillo-type protein [Mycena maculata]|uniref:Armadillo-type protein n=1 Tax=Mycena maculata TaxID=230809 RepID=A0AAD7IZ69_9AGAR|nr:armadillo-type protein [Mycena maculata]